MAVTKCREKRYVYDNWQLKQGPRPRQREHRLKTKFRVSVTIPRLFQLSLCLQSWNEIGVSGLTMEKEDKTVVISSLHTTVKQVISRRW